MFKGNLRTRRRFKRTHGIVVMIVPRYRNWE
jgi:hypothetical protein